MPRAIIYLTISPLFRNILQMHFFALSFRHRSLHRAHFCLRESQRSSDVHLSLSRKPVRVRRLRFYSINRLVEN